MKFQESMATYEDWLGRQLAGELVEEDLKKKHKHMKDSAFVFLRATYWRWAELIPSACPELMNAPSVLGVGDIHVENYGTWRDEDGRLVWGVNDFDEAAEMPYVLDLVRLVASIYLGRVDQHLDLRSICASVLQGYRAGLTAPAPFVLDRQFGDMRQMLIPTEPERDHFWKKLETGGQDPAVPPRIPPPRFVEALSNAFPSSSTIVATRPRSAGTGSLGRPRWVATALWKGGPVVREAKAIVPSAWLRNFPDKDRVIEVSRLAGGEYRAADPWYALTQKNVLVRRLSPNSRKLEIETLADLLFKSSMLIAMGKELANVHLGTGAFAAAVNDDIQSRNKDWLFLAAERAVEFTNDEYSAWTGTEMLSNK